LDHGGCICIPDEEQRLSNITEAINQYRVNWAFFTPSIISLIDPDQVRSHLKTLVLGGEAVKDDNIETWADQVDLINGYGPTEVCVFCVSTPLKRTQPRSDTIRKALGSTSWVVSLENNSQLAAVGSIGELWIESPQLARSYLNNEEATAAAFVVDPPFLQDSSVCGGCIARVIWCGTMKTEHYVMRAARMRRSKCEASALSWLK
jgi:non-ribosomal peptide synthetase component F